MDTFAHRMKYARNRAKMSQEELSRHTEVSKSSISKVEMGLTEEVGMLTLFKFAEAMQIDAHWLATGQDPINKSALGVPGSTGLLEAWGNLPTELREPLLEIVTKAAQAAEQRYWKWIAERDNR